MQFSYKKLDWFFELVSSKLWNLAALLLADVAFRNDAKFPILEGISIEDQFKRTKLRKIGFSYTSYTSQKLT